MCPTRKVGGKVPLEIWTGEKPYVAHFKLFGSLSFTHVADQKRTKLEDKGELMVFVGYHVTEAYKLYDPVNKKMVLRRDVIVLENEHRD